MTQNMHGCVMCESGWRCEVDRSDALIGAPGNSRVSTLMADVSPGNESGGKVSGV